MIYHSSLFRKDGLWYSKDDASGEVLGPFDSKQEAERELKVYLRYIDTGSI